MTARRESPVITFRSWLWPDHTIGKAESRVLRDEHNALVNECCEARQERERLERDNSALRKMLQGLIEWDAYMGWHESPIWDGARRLIETTRPQRSEDGPEGGAK